MTKGQQLVTKAAASVLASLENTLRYTDIQCDEVYSNILNQHYFLFQKSLSPLGEFIYKYSSKPNIYCNLVASYVGQIVLLQESAKGDIEGLEKKFLMKNPSRYVEKIINSSYQNKENNNLQSIFSTLYSQSFVFLHLSQKVLTIRKEEKPLENILFFKNLKEYSEHQYSRWNAIIETLSENDLIVISQGLSTFARPYLNLLLDSHRSVIDIYLSSRRSTYTHSS